MLAERLCEPVRALPRPLKCSQRADCVQPQLGWKTLNVLKTLMSPLALYFTSQYSKTLPKQSLMVCELPHCQTPPLFNELHELAELSKH